MKNLLTALAMALLVAACGSEFSGGYTNKSMTFDFKPDGTVSTVMFGTAVETKYEVKGDTISFQIPGGGNPINLKKEADGSLTHPVLGKFVKK